MKKSTTYFTLKNILPALFVSGLFALSSCGSKEPAAGTETTEAPKSMIADAPKDDGQGIGRFKNVTLAEIDKKAAIEGQTIFESKCSACHNATGVKKVGPGLLGVTQRRQPAWILNMISNPAEMTQKDPTAKELLAQHLTQMTFQDVSDDQIKKILEFLRTNDAAGATAKK